MTYIYIHSFKNLLVVDMDVSSNMIQRQGKLAAKIFFYGIDSYIYPMNNIYTYNNITSPIIIHFPQLQPCFPPSAGPVLFDGHTCRINTLLI